MIEPFLLNKELQQPMRSPANGRAKAWLVAANMGYGHLRAIFPLQSLAHEEIITLGENGVAEVSEYIVRFTVA